MNKKLRKRINKKLIRGTFYETAYAHSVFILGLVILVPCTLVSFGFIALEVVSRYYAVV